MRTWVQKQMEIKELDTQSRGDFNNNQLIICERYKKDKIYDLKKYVKMETVKSHNKIPINILFFSIEQSEKVKKILNFHLIW